MKQVKEREVSNMRLDEMNYDVVGMRLPNGKIQVVKNKQGAKGEVFESEQAFCDRFNSLNEGASGIRVVVMDMINE